MQKSKAVLEFLLHSLEFYTDAPTFFKQLKSMVLFEFAREIEVIDNFLLIIEMALDPSDPWLMIM